GIPLTLDGGSLEQFDVAGRHRCSYNPVPRRTLAEPLTIWSTPMLSHEAIRERTWGPFPALRKVLEDKQLSGEYFGWTSVSDNVFDRLERTLKIGILARDNGESVKEVANQAGWDAMHRDIGKLADELA